MNDVYLWGMWISGFFMGVGASAGLLALKWWLQDIIREAVKEAGPDKKGELEG